MLTKLIRVLSLIGLILLTTGTVLADVSRLHTHLRVMQLAYDVEAASLTLQNGRTVLTNLTPGTVSEYISYTVNRSTFITMGISTISGISLTRQWPVPPLAPGYYTAALVGSALDNNLELLFIDEDHACEGHLASGSCVILVNNIKGSPPLTFSTDNTPLIASAAYRQAVVNAATTGSYQDFKGVDSTHPDVSVFQLPPGFFLPNVIYLYGLTGTYPGQMSFDYTLNTTRRVPVDMMTFLRGLKSDLQFATENIVSILEDSGLDKLLSNQPQGLTVFAPTDGAVLGIDGQVFECVTSNPLALQALILNHVLTGNYTSFDLVNAGSLPTMAGTPLSFTLADGGFIINNQVRVSDAVRYPTTNGIVYLVDTVLVPDGFVEAYCGAG
jgi:uncharacterized surface protein with fasciclin (FAS1) repeats